MKSINILNKGLWIALLFAANVTAAAVFHDVPPPVLQGEILHLELNKTDIRKPVYEAMLFFRMQGEHNFRSSRLKNEGAVLSVDVPTAKLHAGNLEYYFAYQDAAGAVHYLPENDPEGHPFSVKILPASQNNVQSSSAVQILLLSPEPGSVVEPDELVIAFSIPLDVQHPEKLQYKLYISGVDISRLLKRDDHLISFTPKSIRSGLHNVEFKVFDSMGNLLGQKAFSFRVTSKPSSGKGFSSRTSLFMDERYQNIANSVKNYYRAGLRYRASYKKVDFGGHVLLSSEEAADRQPVNHYQAYFVFNFNANNNIYLKGGDFTNNFDPFSFWGKRIRGVDAGFHSTYFDFDYSYGQSYRAVEGAAIADSVTRYGTYKQTFVGFHPLFKFGSHFNWGLDLVNAKDDPASIKYGSNPKEALVLGSTFGLNLHNKRILVQGSVQASIKNEDAQGTIEFDSLADSYDLTGSERDLAERYIDILEKTGFLSLTQGLVPIPSLAWQVETRLRYFNHSLRAMYKYVDTDFSTPGNPYLLRDVAGLFMDDNIRLLDNQVFMNVYFKLYNDNLSQEEAKTKNTEFGGSISYYPFRALPNVTLSYGSQARLNDLGENDVSAADTTNILRIEDNKTQRIGLSSSYNFNAGNIKNVISFSANKFLRDDAVYQNNQSQYLVLTFGLRNRFSFPLTLHWNWSQSNNEIGKSGSGVTTNIQKFNFGLDYRLRKVFLGGDFKPYTRATYQIIDNSGSGNPNEDFERMNYSVGFYIRGSRIGDFLVRYDYIDFGGSLKWKDSILSVRYDLNF